MLDLEPIKARSDAYHATEGDNPAPAYACASDVAAPSK
jgi:hypothetical protein